MSYEPNEESMTSQYNRAIRRAATAEKRVAELEAQLAEAREILADALRMFRLTQNPSEYSADHWSNRAKKNLAGGEG